VSGCTREPSGWVELWSSWRHQIDHVAARGYRAAASSGYGNSSNPIEVERYTMRESTGDVAAVVVVVVETL